MAEKFGKLPEEIEEMSYIWFSRVIAYENAKSNGIEKRNKYEQQKAAVRK